MCFVAEQAEHTHKTDAHGPNTYTRHATCVLTYTAMRTETTRQRQYDRDNKAETIRQRQQDTWAGRSAGGEQSRVLIRMVLLARPSGIQTRDGQRIQTRDGRHALNPKP